MNEKNNKFLNLDKMYYDYYIKCEENFTKGCAYVRVSTDDQVEYSPTSQLKLILNYALENKIFIEEKYIFHDDGISGTKADKRSSFLKMISIAKSKPKPFDVILVYDFSRFARNKDESVMYKTLLRKKLNINVISITQPLTEGKERVILESLYEAMDEYYSLNLSDNVKRGKKEKAERGEHNGNPPFGYDYDKNLKKLIVNPEKAKVVKLIFDMFINSQNLKNIAVSLNDLDIKPMRGGKWGTKTLKIILKNRSYIGEVKHLDKYYKGNHDPIINKEKFDKVQKIWEYRDVHFAKCKIQVQHNHWLRGILKCGSCGKGMVYFQRKDRSDPIFQCSGYSNGRCSNHYLLVKNVEKKIIDLLKKDSTGKININISNNSNPYDDETKILLSALKKFDEKFDRIKSAYINGIDTIEEYKKNKEFLQKEKSRIEDQLKNLNYKKGLEKKKNIVYKKCDEAYKILSDKTVDKKIKFDISHELFDNIIYDKDKNKLIITYK